MHKTKLSPKAPCNPAGPTPVRRPGSLRRTCAIDTCWPDGFAGPMHVTGQARDLLTSAQGEARVLETARFEALLSADQEILRITASPSHPNLQKLVGARVAGRYRAVLADVLADQAAASTLLHRLLEDLTGANFVASFAWAHWLEDRYAYLRATQPRRTDNPERGALEGVCAGFRPGSSSLDQNGFMDSEMTNTPSVGPLARPDDPIGWHEVAPQRGPGARRIRRLDVWREDGLLHLNAHFQDSSATPIGERVSQHEYLVDATADAATLTLLSFKPEARILPFPECVSAGAQAAAMLGTPLETLRVSAPQTLRGVMGCTHLNDMLRSLSDGPTLARLLAEAA